METNTTPLIVDTNILIEGLKKEELLKDLLEYSERKGYVWYLHEVVAAEFLRGAAHKKIEVAWGKYLETLPFSQERVLTSPDLLANAVVISQLYAHCGIPLKQISLADCMLAAATIYGPDVSIATMDLDDFPGCLFDCLEVVPLLIGHRYMRVGIFRFSRERFTAAIQKFELV